MASTSAVAREDTGQLLMVRVSAECSAGLGYLGLGNFGRCTDNDQEVRVNVRAAAERGQDRTEPGTCFADHRVAVDIEGVESTAEAGRNFA